MSRLPKNVREGRTIEQAREYVAKYNDQLSALNAVPLVRITSYDHGHDTCGNGTAHYVCSITWPERVVGPVFDIVSTGKRREQVGYGGPNESALWALEKLGFKLDIAFRSKSDDYRGTGVYPILNWSN